MRNVRVLGVSVAASLLVSAIAQASEPSLPWQVSGGQGIAAVPVVRYPATDWAAVIGTGDAAAVEASVAKSNGVAPARVRSYPKPDWTAAIGRGTAAARPIS
jgi:hypothetical protein